MTMPTRDSILLLIDNAVPTPEAVHDWDETATFVGELLRNLGVKTDSYTNMHAIVAGLVLNGAWQQLEEEAPPLVHVVAMLAHSAHRDALTKLLALGDELEAS
jgi:hypothetical protein